jgi:diguanylate cyclase (GGDEF)-like protein
MTSTWTLSSRADRRDRPSRRRRRVPSTADTERLGVRAAVDEARAVDDSRNRGAAGARNHRRPHSDTALAALYLVGVAAWIALAQPLHARLGVLVACIAAHTIASAIDFEVGPGSVVPTTPVLVACLFLLPAPLVPAVAIAGTVLSSAIGRLRDPSRRHRFPVLIGSAVHAAGPALIFFVVGVTAPRVGDWPVFALAALAQFVFDTAASWFLNCFRLGVSRQSLTAALRFTYFVDLLLFPVGYIVAFVAPGSVAGLLLLAPLLVLLTLLNRDRVRQLDRAIALATHDPLTGLPNRTLFHERLNERLDENRATAVLLIDLDRFKDVNDTLGHALGDDLLIEVGRRLKPLVTTTDLVARLGGDEFAVFVHASDTSDALCCADQLLAQIREPFSIAGLDFDIDASIGVAMADDVALTADDLIRRADVAMYTAKEDRTGRALYSRDRDHYSAERLALAGRLRRGIADGELEMHYQPQIDLASGAVVGVEALVRWNYPGRGLVAPDEFIPVAEQTELIRPLTAFAFATAIAQAAEWHRNGHDLRVSVNLSARNLSEDDLVDTIGTMLATHDLAPSALVVELTETSVMANPDRAADVMRRLRALGANISIDDFGTGHSSLSYLTTLPNDELKVDRSFIQALETDPNAETVVRAIVDLARSLRLEVVAEGVETAEVADLLRRIGCVTAQGYLYSRALPAAAFTSWLRDYNATSAVQRTALPAQGPIRHQGPGASARLDGGRCANDGVGSAEQKRNAGPEYPYTERTPRLSEDRA